MTYPFGPDAGGVHRSYAMRDVDPQTRPVPGDFCADDLHPELVRPTPRSARMAAGATVDPNTVLGVQAAIETDEELLGHFQGSTSAALDYLTSLLAAANVIYERDAKVELLFSYVRLWSTPDPWTSTDTAGALAEVKSYWTNPANGMDAIAGPHDLVHMISGKTVQGGIAYIGSVCDPDYAFGVSQVNASFDVSDPYGIWDVLVFTHEVGHNLGTPHTHCYQPPLDECYNQEPGCYSGPTSVPPGGGTIMSYCHLLAPGLPNVNLVFGQVVSDTIRNTVTAAACLTPVGTCGNGVVEPGEQCDDGNTVSGDGCSATCQNEVVCGDGVVEGDEECDDGNTVSGDGCSATCKREPCAVKIPHQTTWSPARLVSSGDHFVLHARFGIDASLGTPAVATGGIALLVDGASGANEFRVTVPGGAGWTATAHGFRYRDPGGSAGGVRQIVIRMRNQGVTEVDVKLVSRGGAAPSTADAPPTLTLLLGGDAPGTAGACGRYGYAGGTCGVHGKRLSCR
jgi:cysteine-rich repeat protein